MYQFKYIPEREQAESGFFQIGKVLEWMEEVFGIIATGDYAMGGFNGNSHGIRMSFPRNGDDKNPNIFFAMPAYLGGRFQCAGIKWHGPNVDGSSEGAQTRYTLVLNNPQTGVPFGIFPANMLTTYRTAAVSILSAKYLAIPAPVRVGIIGPGKINRLVLEGLLMLFPSIETVCVKGRGRESLDRFVGEVRTAHHQLKEIKIAESFEDAVRGCDIVSVNTGWEFRSVNEMPILLSEWLKPGSTVLCSAFVKFYDDFIMDHAVKVADNLKMYQCYAHDLGYPTYRALPYLGNRYIDLIHEGKMKESDVIDLSDVVAGRHSGREHEGGGIVIVSLGGMAVEDLAVGYELMDYADAHNMGMTLEW